MTTIKVLSHKHLFFVPAVMIGLIILSAPSMAGMDAWTDKNGTVHIVDDLSKVPPEYRKKNVEEPDESSSSPVQKSNRDGRDSSLPAQDTDIHHLIKKLRDPDPTVRQRSALQLGTLKATDAVEQLIRATRDPHYVVQQAAVKALGLIGDPRSVPTLITALNHPRKEISSEAGNALKKIGHPAVERLVAAMNDKRENYSGKQALCLILGEIGDNRAVEPLINALQMSEVAAQAAYALGKIGDDRAIPPLIETLQKTGNKWSRARDAAVGSLTRFGGPLVITALISVLDDENIAYEARNSLLRMRNSSAINSLASTVCDNNERPRIIYESGKALSQMGEPAVEPLIACLINKNCACVNAAHCPGRSTAAYFLGEIKNRRAIGPLIDILNEQFVDIYLTRSMRDIASRSLSQITGQNFGPDYEKWKKWQAENR
jgi:HEAT repeat protein